MAAADPAPAPKRRRIAQVVAGAVAACALAFCAWELATWPDVDALRNDFPPTTAFIAGWQRNDRSGGGAGAVAWSPVPLDRISLDVQLAVLVGEDDRFLDHDGFSRDEMRVALDKAWKEHELPRGASTITQQLAKNLWLSPSRNPWRKVKEALLTRQLERRLGKRRILELYLDVAQFGRGLYGVEAASRQYFGRSASELGPQEAAELAATLPRSSSWHPGVASRSYARHVALLLSRMRRAGELRARLAQLDRER